MELKKGMTIGAMLAQTVEKYSKRNAVEFLGNTWTYGQLDDLTDRIACGMVRLGIGHQTKVGLWANDCPNTLFSFLALEKIGAIPVMFNASWNPLEMETLAEAVDVEYLAFDEGFKGVDFASVCDTLQLSQVKGKIYIGENPRDFKDESVHKLTAFMDSSISESMALQLAHMKSLVKDCDVDMILFTSGSTSTPKGVMTTHYSRVNIGFAQAQMVDATCEDVYCVAIPMFHCFSMGANIMAVLAVGACICFPKNRRTDSIYQAIERAGCTVLTAVPTLYSALLANPNRSAYNISSLRTGLIGGAGCRPELFEAVYKDMGVSLIPSLGQTEATAGITCGKYTDTFKQKATSAGYFIEHVEGKIVDIHSGESLDNYQVGEVCIRGYNVMQGYYNQPELTAKTIDGEGFLHTGDLGYLDGEGRLYLTGRLKELIIRGGENITPLEVENVISADERVELVKVIGVPDNHYGEEVCACVQCVCGKTMEAEDVRLLVSEKLAAYKVPKYVIFMEAIPLLGNGKIDQVALKQYVKELKVC